MNTSNPFSSIRNITPREWFSVFHGCHRWCLFNQFDFPKSNDIESIDRNTAAVSLAEFYAGETIWESEREREKKRGGERERKRNRECVPDAVQECTGQRLTSFPGLHGKTTQWPLLQTPSVLIYPSTFWLHLLLLDPHQATKYTLPSLVPSVLYQVISSDRSPVA